jgi:hypothetical protein
MKENKLKMYRYVSLSVKTRYYTYGDIRYKIFDIDIFCNLLCPHFYSVNEHNNTNMYRYETARPSGTTS